MKITLDDTYCIRSWDRDDVPSLIKYANNRNVWINLWDIFPNPYTHADAHAWIRQCKEQKPEKNFAIATPHEVIGGIGLALQSDVHRMSADLWYWLAEPFWGKGIATLAVKALAEYAFTNFDIVRLYATVFEWNPASARVLEKAGFTLEARLRKNVIKDDHIIDSLLYAKLKEDP